MKAIIIYSSRYGCTEKAVRLLQSKISQDVKAVNVAREKAPDLTPFDTIILGGPIYVGKMDGKLASYIQQNREDLRRKNLALFVCAGEQDPAVMEKQLVSAFPEDLYNRAIAREVLGGELYWDRLDFMTKLMLRIVKGIKEGYARLSEEKIDRFAGSISGLLG